MKESASKEELGCAYWTLFFMLILVLGLALFIDDKHKRVEADLEHRVRMLELKGAF